MNARRRLVIAMGAGAFAPAALLAPRISFAQTPAKIWRIGFLSQRHLEFNDADGYYGPFTQGMRELGYVEGKNLKMEWRSAEGKVERLPALAAELVRLKVDVLVTGATPPALAAGKTLGVTIQVVEAGSATQITGAFAAMARNQAQGVVLGRDSTFNQLRAQILELTAKQRLPAISAYAEFTKAGALVSYGPDARDSAKRGAIYVDKILKGANPGELPVEQPTLFEMVLNLKTAKALGIKVSQAILIQATTVIE